MGCAFVCHPLALRTRRRAYFEKAAIDLEWAHHLLQPSDSDSLPPMPESIPLPCVSQLALALTLAFWVAAYDPANRSRQVS